MTLRGSVVLIVLVLSSCVSAHRPWAAVSVDSLGSVELQTAAYLSLLGEATGEVRCIAVADPFSNRRAGGAPSADVIGRVRATFPQAKPYSPGCERAGYQTVVLAWAERDGEVVNVAAGRWYGRGVRGGVICDMKLKEQAGGVWRVLTPCKQGIQATIN